MINPSLRHVMTFVCLAETQSFRRAADVALKDAKPLAHNAYKVPLAKGLIHRALQSLARA